jgi:Ala-tRNA(Pro) deacylase
MNIYENIVALLKKYNIVYREYDHDPILNYEDAEREKARLGWTGVESKNVFMKGDDGLYYLYITTQGQKVDFKKLKDLLGVKFSIASGDDVVSVIHCVPGCVAPFGFSENIVIVLDRNVFQYDDYLFSPGVTTKTIQLNVKDLEPLIKGLPNKLVEV